MSDIVIPEGDYVEIVKPICINPFGDYFINIKRGSRLRLSKDLKIGDKYAIYILTSYEKYGKTVNVIMPILVRNTRRVLKNELKGLEELVKTTNSLRPTVIRAKDRISDEYVKLCVNMNTKKYNPRKININNDIRIEIKTIIGEVK